MGLITHQSHKELICTLDELKNIIDEMKKVSSNPILTWHREEVNDWIYFLEEHTDKDELRFLEVEAKDRFSHKYDVRLELINLDNQRLNILRKFANQIHNALENKYIAISQLHEKDAPLSGNRFLL